MLEREYEYYKTHKESLLGRCRGQFIVIKNESVLGVYSSQTEAIKETLKDHPAGTFLVQHCTEGEEPMMWYTSRLEPVASV